MRLTIRRRWVIVGAVLVAVAGAAVGSVMAFSGGNERSLGEDERNSAEYFNFDTPIIDGVKVASVDAAKSVLPFDPVTPDQVGAPISIIVRAEAAPAQQILGLVYKDPKYGQFVMIEQPNIGTKEELERLVKQCDDPNVTCEGKWSLTTLSDGSEAAEIVGSPDSEHETTSAIWMKGSIAFDLVGPASSFDSDSIIELANLFEAAAKG